jgi:site-specific DNA-methyltransferase (adenine-specific)
VAAKLNRRFVCVDQNQAAVDVMAKRLGAHADFTALPAAQPAAQPN